MIYDLCQVSACHVQFGLSKSFSMLKKENKEISSQYAVEMSWKALGFVIPFILIRSLKRDNDDEACRWIIFSLRDSVMLLTS